MRQYPWRDKINPSEIDIVAPGGAVRAHVVGYYSHEGTVVFVENLSIDVKPGDEVRRLLPNGKEEVHVIDDPRYMQLSGTRTGMADHYRLYISRRTIHEQHKGGNYNISISGGANPRVNIKSQDSSRNISVHGSVYDGIKQALTETVSDASKLAELQKLVQQMETATDKPSFLKSYQTFIAATGEYISALTPFLPALTELLNKLP